MGFSTRTGVLDQRDSVVLSGGERAPESLLFLSTSLPKMQLVLRT